MTLETNVNEEGVTVCKYSGALYLDGEGTLNHTNPQVAKLTDLNCTLRDALFRFAGRFFGIADVYRSISEINETYVIESEAMAFSV